jgi:hypothetical protein
MSDISHGVPMRKGIARTIAFLPQVFALAAAGLVLRGLVTCVPVILLSAASVSGFAQGSEQKTDLQQKLNATFTPSTVSPNRHYIVTPGAVLVLQKDGLIMYSVDSPLPPLSSYRNGKISQGFGGFGRRMITGGNPGGWPGGTRPTPANYPQRKFGVGEKLWVSQTTVQKDAISFVLYSEPDANNIRYYGELKFPFGKGPVPSPDDTLKMIGEVFTVQPPEQQPAQSAQSAAPPQAPADQAAAPIAPPPSPAESPMAPIAPPPPAADAVAPTPPTVSLGDTKDQVVVAFGQPDKVVHLGVKEIDYYKDMKVTFVDGKVTDVQ